MRVCYMEGLIYDGEARYYFFTTIIFHIKVSSTIINKVLLFFVQRHIYIHILIAQHPVSCNLTTNPYPL